MLKDLRQKTDAELKMMVVQLRARLMENRFKAAQGELKETHLIRELRRLVAQVLTIMHERRLVMETKDYHHFNKILLEEQAKAAAAQTPAVKKPNFLEQAKSKLGSLRPKKTTPAESDGK